VLRHGPTEVVAAVQAEVHPGLELLGCLDALRGVPVPLVYVRDQRVPLGVVQLLEAVMLLVRMRLVR
jgi:hypothetical protein